MKRSEVLSAIIRVLYGPHNADDILTELESIGMLPPEVNDLPQSIIDNGGSAHYYEEETK